MALREYLTGWMTVWWCQTAMDVTSWLVINARTLKVIHWFSESDKLLMKSDNLFRHYKAKLVIGRVGLLLADRALILVSVP